MPCAASARSTPERRMQSPTSRSGRPSLCEAQVLPECWTDCDRVQPPWANLGLGIALLPKRRQSIGCRGPMSANGGGTHEVIQDGRWIVGNYRQDQLLPDGTFV